MSNSFYNKYNPNQTYTIGDKTFTGKQLDNFLYSTGYNPKDLNIKKNNNINNNNNLEIEIEKEKEIKEVESAEITKSIVGKKFLWIGIGLVLVFIILVIMFFTFPPFKAAVDSLLVSSTQSEQCMGDCTSCSNKFTKCC
jgi:predicted RND superfamily exporter protein